MKSKKEKQKRKVRNKQSGQNKIKGIARKVVRFTCLPCGHVRCTIYGRLTKEWKKYHFKRTYYLLEGDFLKKIFFFLDRRHSQKRDLGTRFALVWKWSIGQEFVVQQWNYSLGNRSRERVYCLSFYTQSVSLSRRRTSAIIVSCDSFIGFWFLRISSTDACGGYLRCYSLSINRDYLASILYTQKTFAHTHTHTDTFTHF